MKLRRSPTLEIGEKIKELAYYSDECISKRDSLRMSIPNILHDYVPICEDDQKNILHSLPTCHSQ